MKLLRSRPATWLFASENAEWLVALRLGAAIEVICYCLSLRFDWLQFFALSATGPIKRDIFEATLRDAGGWVPTMSWIVQVFGTCGITEVAALNFAWWALFVSGVLLLVGLFSREAALLAWFIHLCSVKSSGSLAYGVDSLTTMTLFFAAIAPFPDFWSLDWRRTRSRKSPNWQGFMRRILQFQLCIIYLFGGIAKSAGEGWWDGTALWRALIRPPFNHLSPDVLIHFRVFLPAAGIAVCFLEVTYPVFIWLRRTRRIWLWSILAMHVGIGLAMGLYSFALAMITLNVAAFGDRAMLPQWILRIYVRDFTRPLRTRMRRSTSR